MVLSYLSKTIGMPADNMDNCINLEGRLRPYKGGCLVQVWKERPRPAASPKEDKEKACRPTPAESDSVHAPFNLKSAQFTPRKKFRRPGTVTEGR